MCNSISSNLHIDMLSPWVYSQDSSKFHPSSFCSYLMYWMAFCKHKTYPHNKWGASGVETAAESAGWRENLFHWLQVLWELEAHSHGGDVAVYWCCDLSCPVTAQLVDSQLSNCEMSPSHSWLDLTISWCDRLSCLTGMDSYLDMTCHNVTGQLFLCWVFMDHPNEIVCIPTYFPYHGIPVCSLD